jgi:D-alanyl-D-alanine carboxypeptidase
MNHPIRVVTHGIRKFLFPSLFVFTVFSCASAGVVAATTTALPDTPVGKLGGELISHINQDTPVTIRQWALTILSSAIPADDKSDFVASLASAARDSGGVSITDVRNDPLHGLVEVAVKARRTGRWALFVLAADPTHPDKLGQASVFPMDDPAVYESWPRGVVSHAEMTRLIHIALDSLVRTSDFSGCVTVLDGSEKVFDECRGLAERRFGVPVNHQTKFHIGSMDKMFTAVAIAQLVETGKLSWNTTLAELLPEYPDHEAARKITVWQLLHHTAGLGDFLVPEFFQSREKFVDPVDYLDLIARQPKVGEPGKDWNYSNAGYILLGRIIENVSGENYFKYIQRNVFAPAGMSASGFDTVEDVTPGLAVGYFQEGPLATEWKADWMKTGFKGGPAGGGYSTNTDLLRFATALREGKLVKAATLTKMFDDAVPAGPGGYAAGFGDRLSHGRHIRGHAGSIEGTDANLAIVWGTNAAVALTSNEGKSQTWMLAEFIADLLAAESSKL